MSHRERFIRFLTSKGLHPAERSAAVVDTAFTFPGVFGAEDVAEKLQGVVSRPTVYRVLMQMVEAELIMRVGFNGRSAYVAAGDAG